MVRHHQILNFQFNFKASLAGQFRSSLHWLFFVVVQWSILGIESFKNVLGKNKEVQGDWKHTFSYIWCGVPSFAASKHDTFDTVNIK